VSYPTPVPVSEIRQAVETRVIATSLSGGQSFKLSLKPHLFLRETVQSPEHLEIAVGSSSSSARGDRQKPGATVLADTTIEVAFWYQLGAHDHDVDGLLDVEDALRRRVLSQDGTYPATFQITWSRSTRSAALPGWVFCESTFSALHYAQT
jgi:hypothetical protein